MMPSDLLAPSFAATVAFVCGTAFAAPYVAGARASPERAIEVSSERAIGYCFVVDNRRTQAGQLQNSSPLGPEELAEQYFYLYEKRRVESLTWRDAKLIVGPKHGKMVTWTERDGSLTPVYEPAPGYFGDDKISFRVTAAGTTVRVVYLLKVSDQPPDGRGVDEALCKESGKRWKISRTNSAVAVSGKPMTSNPAVQGTLRDKAAQRP